MKKYVKDWAYGDISNLEFLEEFYKEITDELRAKIKCEKTADGISPYIIFIVLILGASVMVFTGTLILPSIITIVIIGILLLLGDKAIKKAKLHNLNIRAQVEVFEKFKSQIKWNKDTNCWELKTDD